MIILKIFKTVFLLIWQLPQALLGLFVLFLVLLSKTANKDAMKIEAMKNRLVVYNLFFSVSLFPFTFVNKRYPLEKTVKHEYGHIIQSMYFGPLYLFVIGIPSVARAAKYAKIIKTEPERYEEYFKGYPENWADKLGGVAR